MDQMIEKISAIEDESKQIMEEAVKKKQDIAEGVKKETAVFDQALEQDTAAQIAALRSGQEKDMEEKLEAQRAEAAEILSELNKRFEACHEEYAERLFKTMTGE